MHVEVLEKTSGQVTRAEVALVKKKKKDVTGTQTLFSHHLF